MSNRIHRQLPGLHQPDRPEHEPYEMNYVVYVKNALPASDPQKCFEFTHHELAKDPKLRNNDKFVKLTFQSSIEYTCHGFVGYFEATLYNEHKISTVPATFTPGMFSWFPIYFPLRNPMLIPAYHDLTLLMWRLSDERSVWYEWSAATETSGPTPIHNSGGRSFPIGLH